MDRQTLHSLRSRTWKLIRRQHGVISRLQLLDLGWSRNAIAHRVGSGRLHILFRGVYAVGRPEVTREGWWMAAVLAAGEGALLSHGSGAALFGIAEEPAGPIHVSVPLTARRSREGIEVHPRKLLPGERTTRERIAVATVAVIVTDLAAELRRGPLESAINQADILGLTTAPKLRAASTRCRSAPAAGTCARRSTGGPSGSRAPALSGPSSRSP
jgi:predicted transcriptional regulator of viral defense system